jgi:DNA-binding transcriptional MerR regulator
VEKGMETCEGKIDKEWVELILTAKQLGLTIEEIQDFIKQSKTGSNKGKIPEHHK